MSENLIEQLEKQKMKIFGTFDSTEQALKEAHDLLADCPKGQVTAAILQYHNTLIDQIQGQIKQVQNNDSSS